MRSLPASRLVPLLLCSAMACTADSMKQARRRPVETPPLGPYVGPLYETHLHMATFGSLEDSRPRYRVDLRDDGERDPALSADAYIASMDRTGIACTLGFHSVAVEEVADGGDVDRNSVALFQNADRIHAAHSDRIKLFAEVFRHNPAQWFDAGRLRPVLERGTFSGLGEFQLANPPFSDSDFGERNYLIYPNDPRLMEIYAMLSELGMPLMLHPGSTEGLDEAIAAYPDLPWIIHGWQVHDEWQDLDFIDALFAAHPNLYYTIDFAETLPEHLEIMKNRRGADLETFQDFMEDHADAVAGEMGETWTPIIERWPDRFTWGTDIARPKWQWTEPGVIDAITEVSRAYLGTLPPEVAEQVAWKNAAELLGPCAELSQ